MGAGIPVRLCSVLSDSTRFRLLFLYKIVDISRRMTVTFLCVSLGCLLGSKFKGVAVLLAPAFRPPKDRSGAAHRPYTVSLSFLHNESSCYRSCCFSGFGRADGSCCFVSRICFRTDGLRSAAAETCADSLTPGSFRVGEQTGKPFLRCGMFFDKRPAHIGDSFHKSLGTDLAALHLFESGFPFRGKQRGFDIIRQDCNQVHAFFSWEKLFLFPFHKSDRHQLFQRGRTGGRSA